ncbi:AAA family ATPase [Candidatus Saccharibacteria bacterium]|nr:AAA family ATPase [Candidatus Saccharibacteria bacterium]
MKLIGIAGTNGSGKDTVGTLLAKKHGFLFISVTEMLREECRTRGLAVERENLRMISAEWRREGGLGVLVDKAVAVYEQLGEEYQGLAVASLRNPGEVDRVHELGGKVVWVDADSQVRYDRIQTANRGRGSEDTKTYEQFLAEEAAEMQSSGDAATLDMSAVKDKCDATILNEGSEAELDMQLTTVL